MEREVRKEVELIPVEPEEHSLFRAGEKARAECEGAAPEEDPVTCRQRCINNVVDTMRHKTIKMEDRAQLFEDRPGCTRVAQSGFGG